MRRRTLFNLGTIALLAVIGYLGYTQVYAPSVASTPTPAPVEDFETVIWASGEIVPARWANLSFPISGRVIDLPVSEGTQVRAGEVVARLDTAELEDGLAAAEAGLAIARADLAHIQAGPRPVNDSQDDVSHVVSKYNLLALPVVDDQGRLHGIVTSDDALDKIIPTAWKKKLPSLFR